MATVLNTVPFFMHDLGDVELSEIATVFKGSILTTGDTVSTFERKFAELVRSKYALGVTSCTGALHMSLIALGIGPGDEVITTPMTFIASSTAILEAGATPVFVDVEPDTGNIDATKIEAAITSKTKAILPVHLYGQMCDMKFIKDIALRHNLKIVEDAAHCVEGTRDGFAPGQLADTACFSFYATKNLTCGEGGAVITNDSEVYEKLKLLRTHGMNKTANDRSKEGYKHWDMPMLGWKYNMDNIQAAILLPQLKRLSAKSQSREFLAQRYLNGLQTISGVKCLNLRPGVKHAWHLFPILINQGKRDEVIGALQSLGINVMVNYRAIHLLTYFKQQFGFECGDFPIAENFGDSIVSLPFYPQMPVEHVDRVLNALKGICG